MRAVFLAAGKSKRIFKKIGKNKCLLKINKITLIEHAIKEIHKTKINDISIVLGFKPNLIRKNLRKFSNINFLTNKKYNTAEMLYTLIFALQKYNSDIIFIYSDIVFSYKTINKIIRSKKKNILLPVLSNWKKIWKIRNKDPYKDAETLYINKYSKLKSIGMKIEDLNKVKNQFMGILFIPKAQRKRVLNFYNKSKFKKKLHLTNFLNKLVKKNFKIDCIRTNEKWYEFDDYFDYLNYKKKFLKG
tara:strand:- start:153 stop:887 length:735 start_codon:yes stop_codon:yes gene_type:complete